MPPTRRLTRRSKCAQKVKGKKDKTDPNEPRTDRGVAVQSAFPRRSAEGALFPEEG
jgi:hypothetical protein